FQKPPTGEARAAGTAAVPGGDPDLVSLVIPVFNERESLPSLATEIGAAVGELPSRVEVLFIDDGSTDGSWETIRELAAADPRVRGLRFRRNFGKAAALQAGFRQARGWAVLTLDADLQDDPKEIPRFLAAVKGGLDVACGWKKVRYDPWHKVFPSRVFNWLVSRVTGVKLHDHNCGFKAYRAEVLSEVRLYGELHRFVPVLAAGRGFKVGELVIKHRPRRFGHSKYGFRRFTKGFLDLISVQFLTGFGDRPQHFLGRAGLLPILLGCLGLIVIVVNWLLRAADPTAWIEPMGQVVTAIVAVGLLLFGAQLLITGLLAELIVDRGPADEDPYAIVERTG
ncbi:MAG TPA: glycosyltransferase family 2 protein, partial [Fimbriiglobus sp.]|nr:glycosyltransferase family 2 protein [Fimbriiglobus sp.]